jgi:hypothetical protein
MGAFCYGMIWGWKSLKYWHYQERKGAVCTRHIRQSRRKTVSIVAKIKQKFLEDPEYFDEWVSKLMEDGKERRAIMEQLDGKAKQAVEVTGANGGPVETIIGMRVMKDGA